MNLVFALLRVIHIFSAVIWVGGGIFFLNIIAPAVKEAGPDGGKFMQVVARQGRLANMFAAVSGLTFLSGLILYLLLGYLNTLTSARGISLTLGAMFGTLAFVHGLLVTGRLSRQSVALAREMAAAGGPPKPEQLQQAQALGAKQLEAAMHSVILISLGLLGMAAAQTL